MKSTTWLEWLFEHEYITLKGYIEARRLNYDEVEILYAAGYSENQQCVLAYKYLKDVKRNEVKVDYLDEVKDIINQI